MLLALLVGMPLPSLPLQILWINLVTDGLPGLALGVEPPERDTMRRPPHHPQENIFILRIDAPPPGLPTCHRIACALDVSLVTVLWLAWVKSPIGLALQVACLGSLFDQLSDEDQEALLEKQKEMVKAHRKAIAG